MTATASVKEIETSTGYPAFSYLVELEGNGRGLYAAASWGEAKEIAKRINDYPVLENKLLDAEKKITRLKKQLCKLRQTKRKGNK